jgi:hypothetical protein
MSSANCVNTQGVGTAINTTTYVRCSVEAVLANPVIGVRIVTSGDAVNVDFAQNEANTFPTPPIATTTVSVARAADGISATTTLSNLIPITTATMLFNMGAVPWGNDGTDHVLLAFLQSGSTPGVGRFSGGTSILMMASAIAPARHIPMVRRSDMRWHMAALPSTHR